MQFLIKNAQKKMFTLLPKGILSTFCLVLALGLYFNFLGTLVSLKQTSYLSNSYIEKTQYFALLPQRS